MNSELRKCLTSLLVRVAIVVVLDVQSAVGSAINIASNAIVNTTGNDGPIRVVTTASTKAQRGDGFERRSCDKTRCARPAWRTIVSLLRTLSTTEYPSAMEALGSIGTICRVSAGHAIRVNQRRKDHDGGTCRGWGRGTLNRCRGSHRGGALVACMQARFDWGESRNCRRDKI